MYRQTDGGVNVQMEWMDRQTNGGVDGLTEEWMDRQTDGGVGGQTDRRRSGWIDRQMEE